MKIWHGYGSEHSMNLVMIGHFKSHKDAKKTQKLISQLIEELEGKIEVGARHERFSDEVYNILRDANCYILGPAELEHFLYEVDTQLEDDKIILKTDESEVSAFFKIMINSGAKVEIYSAHDYPETKYGRGK